MPDSLILAIIVVLVVGFAIWFDNRKSKCLICGQRIEKGKLYCYKCAVGKIDIPVTDDRESFKKRNVF